MEMKEVMKNAMVGGTLALAALGFGGSRAEAGQAAPSNDNRAVKTSTDTGQAEQLNTSTHTDRFSGALKGALPPEYDGAVKWEEWGPWTCILGSSMLAGMAGAGVGVIASGRRGESYIGKGFLAGLVLGGGLGYAIAPTAVQFETRIQEIVSAEAPHTEMRQQGRIRVETGPYFGQVLSIPETDLLLAANNKGAPFLPGQKVKVAFLLDGSQRIIGWSAEAAAR